MAGFEKRYHGVVSAFMFATETQQTIGETSLQQSQHCKHIMHALPLPPSQYLLFITPIEERNLREQRASLR